VLEGELAEDSTVAVMDLDERRVNTISTLARKMPEMKDRNIEIKGTTDLVEALDGADFVYNVIRVGGVDGMERDKRIGLKYGYHGHDDFGPSAAMITLRTVPVVLKITAEMEKRCPKAWLLSFTNPVPFIVRAVKDFSKIKCIGLCGGDRNQLYDIPKTLGWDEVPCMDLDYRGVGIDHFSWSSELTYKGNDFYPELFEAVKKLDRKKMPYYCRMSVEVLELYRQWLSSSAHCFHWTHHDELVSMLRNHYEKMDKEGGSSRHNSQELAMDAAAKYAEEDAGDSFWERKELKNVPSKTGFAALGIKVITSMLADAGEEMMVNMHAPGAVGNLQDDGIVLISAKLHRDRPRPLHFEGVPEGIAGLTRQILEYQGALVRAAVQGGRRELEVAITTDPIMRDLGKVRNMLDELLEANRGQIRGELLKG
jgi:alpha-galactosidase